MESYWGGRRFLLYYVVCGLGAGLVQEGVQYIQYLWQGLGAYDTVNIGYTVISMGDYLNRWTLSEPLVQSMEFCWLSACRFLMNACLFFRFPYLLKPSFL